MWKETTLVLLQSLYSAYIMLLLLRFFFQLVRVDFYNPISQVVVKLASPIVFPLQKIIPSWQNISFSTLVAVLLMEALEITVIFPKAGFGHLPHFTGAVIWIAGDLINHVANLFFFAILIQALMSWLHTQSGHPLLEILYRLTLPILKPFQRMIPPIAGIDLSAIPALFLLQCLNLYVGNFLLLQGWALM
ncbi:MAG: YggT family protein [Legionellales bacterium]|nr:YggT family protein [Legionellales bacterium]